MDSGCTDSLYWRNVDELRWHRCFQGQKHDRSHAAFRRGVVSPFEVLHTDSELSELARLLKSLDGETRVVMESTGNYHAPVAWLLHGAGLYVSVVNAMLVHDYGNNSLRRGKTDKKDAVKLANYGLDHWLTLPRYVPEEDTRLMLKTCYRQYQQYSKVQTMLKNNLISLLDTTFPDANRLFASPPRADGSEKWVDFVDAFWHCECVCGLSEKTFITRYQKCPLPAKIDRKKVKKTE